MYPWRLLTLRVRARISEMDGRITVWRCLQAQTGMRKIPAAFLKLSEPAKVPHVHVYCTEQQVVKLADSNVSLYTTDYKLEVRNCVYLLEFWTTLQYFTTAT